jgi:glycerol kinase
MLYNINTLDWDDRLLREMNIPRTILPEVRSSCGEFATAILQGNEIPIMGVAGDQQAALFGQQCFEEGEVKNTYGTGCFLLMNTGAMPVSSKFGLVTTIAAGVGDAAVYALEGSVFTAGAVVQWLRDELKLIGIWTPGGRCSASRAAQTEAILQGRRSSRSLIKPRMCSMRCRRI